MLAKSTEPSAAHQIPKQLQNLGVLLVFVGGFFLLLFFFLITLICCPVYTAKPTSDSMRKSI